MFKDKLIYPKALRGNWQPIQKKEKGIFHTLQAPLFEGTKKNCSDQKEEVKRCPPFSYSFPTKHPSRDRTQDKKTKKSASKTFSIPRQFRDHIQDEKVKKSVFEAFRTLCGLKLGLSLLKSFRGAHLSVYVTDQNSPNNGVQNIPHCYSVIIRLNRQRYEKKYIQCIDKEGKCFLEKVQFTSLFVHELIHCYHILKGIKDEDAKGLEIPEKLRKHYSSVDEYATIEGHPIGIKLSP